MRGITIITVNSETGEHFQQFHAREAILGFGLRNAITWMHFSYKTDLVESITLGTEGIGLIMEQMETLDPYGLLR